MELTLYLVCALLSGHFSALSGIISNKKGANYSHSCLSEVCPNHSGCLEKELRDGDLH